MPKERMKYLKSQLVKHELESTPWESVVTSAKQILIKKMSEIPSHQLEAESEKLLGNFDIDPRKNIDSLAEYKIVSSSSQEIVEFAYDALQAEYAHISLEDLEVLYRLFRTHTNKKDENSTLETV